MPSRPASALRSSRARRQRRLLLEPLERRELLAAFTPGNLVAYRVGPSGSPLGLNDNATQVFLDEFSVSTGALVQSIAMPTTSVGNQHSLTARGTSVTEGLLTRSSDGKYLLLTGYDATLGTSGLGSSTAAAVNRVVGRVDSFGSVDTSTVIADGFNGGMIRGAISDNGINIWAAGSANDSSNGVRYTTFGHAAGTPTTRLNSTDFSGRGLAIFDGQLYASASPATFTQRIAKVGTGLPTTAGQSFAGLPGLPAPSGSPSEPHQFFLADLSAGVPGPDTLYVADENTTGVGYVWKFSLVAGAWTQNGNITLPNLGTRGMTGKVVGGVATLFVTETEPSGTFSFGNNSIRKLVDSSGYGGSVAGASLTFFAQTGVHSAYRGIAFVPELPTPTPVVDAGNAGNNIVVKRAGGNVQVTVDSTLVLDRALAGLTSLTINGQDGADTLTIDYAAGGFFNLPIAYDGGNPASAPGDKLQILGGTFTSVATTYTGPSSGGVNLDGTVISFTGIEPLLIDADATANYLFNLPASADNLQLRLDAGTNLILDSLNGTFEDTTFDFTGAAQIALNLGAGSDNLSLAPLGAYGGQTIVSGEADDDSIAVSAGATLTANANHSADLILSGGQVNLTAAAEFDSLAGASGMIQLGASTLTVGADGSSTTFGGAIGGAGGLTKVGGGTLTLAGVNTFAGGTAVNAGTLKLGLPLSPVARYALDGDTLDASGNGHNGAIVGAGTSFVPGRFGQALSFTGSQQVVVPFAADLALTSFTVSAWVNIATEPGAFGILGTRFGGENTFDVKVQNNNIHGDVGDGAAWINTAVDITAGDVGSTGQGGDLPHLSWHLVTYVIDQAAGQFRLFLDGDLKRTIGFAGTPLFMKPG